MRSRIAITTGIALVAALAPVLPAAAQPGSLAEDLARWVNPYVGTKPGGADHGTGGGAGTPYKTQALTRRMERELFRPGPDGLVGNDDLGQMSALYVWAAMGLYPMIPGRAELVLNSPLFTEVVISRPGGRTLTIKAPAAATTVP